MGISSGGFFKGYNNLSYLVARYLQNKRASCAYKYNYKLLVYFKGT